MSEAARPLTPAEHEWLREKYPSDADYRVAYKRYLGGEPLAYVLGETVFYDETYRVTPDVLIPRPDTERLCERCVKLLAAKNAPRMLDLCTGSGCIAISCAVHTPALNVTAADISPAALEIARENAVSNGVADRLSFIEADIRSEDGAVLLRGEYDVIVSNPPYITDAAMKTLDRSVIDWEPSLALAGGADGMDFYRAILRLYPAYLRSDGAILFEIGYDQREAICSCTRECGFDCVVEKDYGGNDRVAILTRPRG